MQQAHLVPTMAYGWFSHAESLHRTVAEYFLGGTRPMSQMESYLWDQFRLAQERINQQNRPRETRGRGRVR